MSRSEKINKLLAELGDIVDAEQKAEEDAEQKRIAALAEKERAKNARKSAEKARNDMIKLQEQNNELDKKFNQVVEENGLSDSLGKDQPKKNRNWVKSFITGALVVALALPGGHFLAKGFKKVTNNNKTLLNVQEFNVDNENDLMVKFREFLANKGIVRIDEMVTGRYAITPLVSRLTMDEVEDLAVEFMKGLSSKSVYDDEELAQLGKTFCKMYLEQLGISVVELDINDTIGEIATLDHDFSKENFENIVAEFTKILYHANLNVSTEQVVKLVSIINIDKLCEENSDLVNELFSVQTKEEYMTDVFCLLGMIAQYNSDLYFKNGTTDGFIRISDAVIGNEDKAILTHYESYVDDMAAASMKGDAEEVNRLAEKFIASINNPTSDYSYISDGIGLGLYSSIEAMISTVSRDTSNTYYLDKDNENRLVILSYSEKYISNIHRQYDECITEGKTKSLTK